MGLLNTKEQMNRLLTFLEPSQLIVDDRFQGPPAMGNGGYTAGRLAELVGADPVTVTLRKPVPLTRPLSIEKVPDQTILLCDEDVLLAEAHPAALDLDVPHAPSYAQAIAARPALSTLHHHPFAHCFVCGPQREAGDGLRIFPGPVHGRALVASPWIPDASLADTFGNVRTRFLWAALDCPGAFAVSGEVIKPMVLGRITGSIQRSVQAGERLIVIGWEIGRDGRKLFAGTALFNESGSLIGKAKAIWFEL